MAASTRQAPVRYPNNVRLYAPTATKPFCRIVWYDPPSSRDPRDRYETTERDVKVAEDTAETISTELSAGRSTKNLELRRKPFDVLLDHYLDIDNHLDWGEGHATTVRSLMDTWVRPVVGRYACEDIDQVTWTRVIRKVLDARERSTAEGVRRGINAAIVWGTAQGYFPKGYDAFDKVRVPKGVVVAGRHPDYVPERLRPKTERVALLVEAASTIEWWRGLHFQTAAYSGLRLGETFAIRTCHVGRGKNRTIAVNWQYRGNKPTLARPKGGKTRTTVYPKEMQADLERRCAEAVRLPGQPICPDCGDPSCALLFPSPRGLPQPRRNFTRDIFAPAARATEELASARGDKSLAWPKDETSRKRNWLWTFHSLRHHSACWFVNVKGRNPADAALLLGHTPQTFMNRYYGADEGAIARAVEAMES